MNNNITILLLLSLSSALFPITNNDSSLIDPSICDNNLILECNREDSSHDCDLGDINCDDEIDILDIISIINIILVNGYDLLADLNIDQSVNILDMVIIANWILEGVPVVPSWVTVLAGTFTYGSSDDILHINYDFEISKYEITNAQYKTYLEDAFASDDIEVSTLTVWGYYEGDEENAAGNYEYLDLDDDDCRISYDNSFNIEDGYENHPVVEVSWFGANAFAKYYGMRLPNEYEWEKAARGNTGYDYPFGDNVDGSQVNYLDSGCPLENGTTHVGSFNGQNIEGFQTTDSPSPYNAYDMAGNVREWTDDWYSEYSTARVQRGGSWHGNYWMCKLSYRNFGAPYATNGYVGFRVIRYL